jgi:hypothetical protein
VASPSFNRAVVSRVGSVRACIDCMHAKSGPLFLTVYTYKFEPNTDFQIANPSAEWITQRLGEQTLIERIDRVTVRRPGARVSNERADTRLFTNDRYVSVHIGARNDARDDD